MSNDTQDPAPDDASAGAPVRQFVTFNVARETYAVPLAEVQEIIRLPEGSYHVVSTYGESNAIMRADLKVEVGKLTEATLNHRAATVLSERDAEIERLRGIISSMPDPSTAPSATATTTEFRRRTRALSDDGSTISPETDVGSYVEDAMVQPDGVPLQVVIIVALGVFITTYLFF